MCIESFVQGRCIIIIMIIIILALIVCSCLQVDVDAASQSWAARGAVLRLMAATLEQSPAAARAALRHEAVLLVLFGFLRRRLPRRLALHMVRQWQRRCIGNHSSRMMSIVASAGWFAAATPAPAAGTAAGGGRCSVKSTASRLCTVRKQLPLRPCSW